MTSMISSAPGDLFTLLLLFHGTRAIDAATQASIHVIQMQSKVLARQFFDKYSL